MQLLGAVSHDLIETQLAHVEGVAGAAYHYTEYLLPYADDAGGADYINAIKQEKAISFPIGKFA